MRKRTSVSVFNYLLFIQLFMSVFSYTINHNENEDETEKQITQLPHT